MRLTRDGVVTVLLVIAALFVGTLVADRVPDAQAVLDARYERHGAVGDPVPMRTGTVTVTGVRSAKQVSSFADTATTRGVWVVLDLTWRPSTEPFILSGDAARIEAPDGRLFGGSSALITSCTPTQPGVTFACSFAFEMDPTALAGSRALFPAVKELEDPDDIAVIDLGIDPDEAARLAAATGSIRVPVTTVKEP